MAHHLETHWVVVKRILRYLKGTLGHDLHLTPLSPSFPPSFRVFCDADWASDPDDRRSTSSAVVFFGNNLITWWSKKQQVVARSSNGSEYRSLELATTYLLWI